MIAPSQRALTAESAFQCRLCGTAGEPIVLGPNADFVLGGGEPARIVRCPRCSLPATDPLPGDRELAEAYHTAYRLRRREGPDPRYLRESDNRAAAQWTFLRRAVLTRNGSSAAVGWNSPQARILDVGCAAGSFLFARRDSSAALAGFEPDRAMCEAARQRLPQGSRLFNSVFDASRLAGGRFDLIAASHVLEHVPEPVAFLGQLLEALADGGRLFLEVPNEDAETIAALTACEPLGRMHLYFFDPQKLTAVVEAAGGEVVALGTFGEPKARAVPPSEPRGVAPAWMAKLRVSAHPAARALRTLYRARRLRIRRKRMFIERKDGDCLRVIAAKGPRRGFARIMTQEVLLHD